MVDGSAVAGEISHRSLKELSDNISRKSRAYALVDCGRHHVQTLLLDLDDGAGWAAVVTV